MHTLIVIGITVVSTVALYSLVLYIKNINKKVIGMMKLLANFPSPEQMAKEILKVKLPLTDLPPELQKKAMNNLKNKKSGKIDDKDVQKSAPYIG